MSEAFIAIVNMSISASWIIAAVMIVRLLLKKAPKWISVMLWGIVGVRLTCPFTIESALSLVPSAHTVSYEMMTDKSPEINLGIPFINDTLNPVISDSLSAALADSANPMQILLPVLVGVWLAGMAAMLIYAAVSYILLKKRIANALPIRDNVFSGENVASPFVLGIIKPKIYLPVNISERNAEKVILHEEAHIRRRDHIIKPIGFLLLCVYWFNPLVWLGYILLCKDIELACDERAVKNFSSDQLADYSQALLSCSVNRRIIAACPIAFGEVSVKSRVKSVLHYKKPAFWVVVAAIVASIVVAVCFLTSPKTDDIVASDGEPGTASSNYAINPNLYEKTPLSQTEDKIERGEYIITKTHQETLDGKWTVDNTEYEYRLEITGRLGEDAKNTTFIVLSNKKQIRFSDTWPAFGFGSDTSAYFDPDEAVIVGYRIF